jgi:hypothetical protein
MASGAAGAAFGWLPEPLLERPIPPPMPPMPIPCAQAVGPGNTANVTPNASSGRHRPAKTFMVETFMAQTLMATDIAGT